MLSIHQRSHAQECGDKAKIATELCGIAKRSKYAAMTRHGPPDRWFYVGFKGTGGKSTEECDYCHPAATDRRAVLLPLDH